MLAGSTLSPRKTHAHTSSDFLWLTHYFSATQILEKLTLTGNLTGLMFQYITNTGLPAHKRQFVAVAIKNIVKKAYGQHTFTHYEEQQKREGESVAGDESDPQSFIDAGSLQQIHTNIVTLAMQCADKSV